MFVEIVSPEKTLFTGDVSSVHLPGSEGSFQILNNHAPIVSTLKEGLIKLKGKTTEKLGLIGKEKAIACEVICSISKWKKLMF